jgi:hypothetical protein
MGQSWRWRGTLPNSSNKPQRPNSQEESSMINKLGGIHQLALVVKDAETTMLTLSKTLGIGPFFVVRNMIPDDFRFLGRPAH